MGTIQSILLTGKREARIPLWFMRQAGRYLPEYRAKRAQAGSFLKLCLTPEYAAEVTLQPLQRFDIDAAIIFADILLIPMALGQTLDFAEGEGPILTPSLMMQPDWQPKEYDSGSLAAVFAALGLVKNELKPHQDLIGFAGSPWTVLTYMIRGHKGVSLEEALLWAQAHPHLTKQWLNTITQATIPYLMAQIEAGATIIQLFDTWAGIVPAIYQTSWLFEPADAIVGALKKHYPNIPFIYFGKGLGEHIRNAQTRISAQGFGIDDGMPPSSAARLLPEHIILQGNLSPQTLRIGGDDLNKDVHSILSSWKARPYIFNLGHGILPDTPIENVERMIDIVRQTPKS